MKTKIAVLATLFLSTLPLGSAHAQSADAAYCQALADKYTTYVADPNEHRPAPALAGVTTAIAQCNAGNMAGIPVLERALTDAQVALPTRG